MNYEAKRTNYANFENFKLNRMEARAYFIPFGDKSKLDKTTFRDERKNSDRVEVLSGEWNFKYLEKCQDLPNVIDTENFGWEKVAVPSTWQHTGYEKPFYLNRRYQFPKKPPMIPANIPVGVYSRKFNIGDTLDNNIITFLGSASCVEVYLNGEFLGYSEVSHNKAEFDTTKFLVNGENEILVLVYKFCNGSYLECQDMYRENGIFRDVYITCRKSFYLEDIVIKTPYDKKGYSIEVEAATCNGKGKSLKVTLFDNKGKEVFSKTAKLNDEGSVLIKEIVSAAREWSAEIPNLSSLEVELLEEDGKLVECERFQVGFKRIEIMGNVYYFNGQKIKMKGVNHHDSNPYTGYAVTLGDMEKDLRVMKSFNVNTIRTSHYPKDPIFLQLCNEYGFYVCDEADIETHGFYNIPGSAAGNRLSDDQMWREHYVDRVYGMVKNDINNPCVSMWSLGNESGGISNQDECDKVVKKLSDIPVHYEGAIYHKRACYDIVSQMYPHQYHVARIGNKTAKEKFLRKPYFMCEYAHSMGLGAGSYKEYWESIYQCDNLLGGCVWEFCDHSAFVEGGKYKWTYGGDHDEYIHDGNFCVDGLFYPDRTPSTGAYQMRHFYSPLRTQRVSAGKYKVYNLEYFKTSKGIKIEKKILCGGVVREISSLEPDIKPQGEFSFEIAEPNTADTIVQFVYVNKLNNEVMGEDEIVITAPVLNLASKARSASASKPEKVAKNIVFNCENVEVSFDKKTGALSSYKINGTEIINNSRGITQATVSRALIDNEMFIKILFNIIGFNHYKLHSKLTSVKVKDGVQTVKVTNSLYRFILGDGPKFGIIYSVFADGSIDVTYKLKRATLAKAFLPKVGFNIRLLEEFDSIKYYAKGERENYSDLNDAMLTGLYSCKVADNHEEYIKPQENGNHTEGRWLEVTNNDGVGIKISATESLLNFNFHDYTIAELQGAGHIEELARGGVSDISVDGFTRGVGSNSCGPLVLAPYTFKNKKREYSFRIEAIKTNK